MKSKTVAYWLCMPPSENGKRHIPDIENCRMRKQTLYNMESNTMAHWLCTPPLENGKRQTNIPLWSPLKNSLKNSLKISGWSAHGQKTFEFKPLLKIPLKFVIVLHENCSCPNIYIPRWRMQELQLLPYRGWPKLLAVQCDNESIDKEVSA